jgi:hypothetical protein
VGEADHPVVLERDEQDVAGAQRRVPAQLGAVDVHRLEVRAEDRLVGLAVGLDVEHRHCGGLVGAGRADQDGAGCGRISWHR